jgi:hypothetical protein
MIGLKAGGWRACAVTSARGSCVCEFISASVSPTEVSQGQIRPVPRHERCVRAGVSASAQTTTGNALVPLALTMNSAQVEAAEVCEAGAAASHLHHEAPRDS